MAPQSTTTNGRPARVLAWCTASATSPLPVPVSPSMSTVESVAAMRGSSENRRRIDGLRPMTAPKLDADAIGSRTVSSSSSKRIRVAPSRRTAPFSR